MCCCIPSKIKGFRLPTTCNISLITQQCRFCLHKLELSTFYYQFFLSKFRLSIVPSQEFFSRLPSSLTNITRSKTHNQHSSQTMNFSCTSAKKKPNTPAKTAQTASDGSPRASSICYAMYVQSSSSNSPALPLLTHLRRLNPLSTEPSQSRPS